MKLETTPDKGEQVLRGIGVSNGIAIGPAFVIDQTGVPVPEYTVPAAAIDKEVKRLQTAIAKTLRQLAQLKQKAAALPASAAEDIGLLLEAYRGMLGGSRIVGAAENRIRNEHLNAEAAMNRTIGALAASFAAMEDPYLASRATDVREVGSRVIRNLMQQHYNPFTEAPAGCILIAEDITPADTAQMDPERIAGFAAVLGGPEGHAAIMARAMRLPAVMGVSALAAGITTGDVVIIDGRKGEIVVHPTPARLAAARQEAARHARELRRLRSFSDLPAITLDGTSVVLEANLELPREAAGAIEEGASGIGLLRTEFLFMNRRDLPDEDEQFAILRDLVKDMQGRPVTIRTLDVGGEKLVSALGEQEAESPNPALGLRAIRLGLKEPKLLDTQLAAILRAAAYGPVRILVPMVSSASQMRTVRARLVQIMARLRRRGVKLPAALPPLGAMIEIPSAALTADSLARVCDFFAIGSNDLTQYTLAIDRSDDRVAHLYDPLHPGVLRLIQFTLAAAWRANIPVSLCGEMASDPRASALLLGLGLRDFSMAPARIPIVKEQIRKTKLQDALGLAEAIMSKNEESDIRALLDGAGAKTPS